MSDGGHMSRTESHHPLASQLAEASGRYRPLSPMLAITPSVSVVIPVKNEARNIPMVLDSLPSWVNDVVLVDGRSTDDTVDVARSCRPDIKVVTQPGSGKGDALRAGFKECSGDIVVMMDGDGSTAGTEIVRFVGALVAGADFAKGSRFASGGGSGDITPSRRLGNRVLSGMVNLVFGTSYTDLCYGYNAFWSTVLPDLALDGGGFEIETVMNIRAAKADLKVQEVPSYERPRVHGESNLHLLVDGLRIVGAIAAEWREKPLRRRRGHRWSGGPRPAHGADGFGRLHPAGPDPGRGDAPVTMSVVICAHSAMRFADTGAAVQSVREQSLPSLEIILVVDHNPALFASLAAEHPDVTVIENREAPGLSGAKNTGVAAASGDVVAFLDDDAVADADWLKFLADSYVDPAVVGVGGLTLPSWKRPRPPWFPEEFYWVVGCTYRGMPVIRAPVRNLLGGNASFRREVFAVVGGFKNGLGRSRDKRPLGCEETEFCIRLNRSMPDSVLLFDNRATIWHLVPAERCRFSYFWSRCYAEGLSKAVVTASVGTHHGLSTERSYTARTLPMGVADGVREALRGDPTGLGRAGAIVSGLAATVAGYATGSVTRFVRRPATSARRA
jgi:glucosyl-dolichyl phosphate glucuronosyltransferase